MQRMVGLALAAALTMTPDAAAQETGRGFMFRRPLGSVAVRGGFTIPSTGGEIFSFTVDQLTIDRSDFTGWAAGGDGSLWLSPRWDIVLRGQYAEQRRQSEFRRWVDNNDLPIRQTTTFERVPVTIGGRFYLTPRGRSIGRFAWMPARWTVYVGAGLGATWYRFRQQGDFIDFATLKVFGDDFDSMGLAPTAQAFAGAELAVLPVWSLSLETHYSQARANLGRDFVGFDPISLSGFFATFGIVARF